MLVDSHCHLNFPDFRDDLDAVIARAGEAGVGVMQTICTEMAEFDEVVGIAERYPQVYSSVGVHPNESGKTAIVDVNLLIEMAKHPKIIGLGETGLDYHYETSDRPSQKQSFLNHIAAARATGLPLIIHTRDADDDTAGILLAEAHNREISGVLHCFTSSLKLAEIALELGFYISFSGILTFKNAANLREVVKIMPLDRILVETDAPYLAPVPHRGKRNEPAYTKYTNKLIAELKQVSEEECAAATTENFFRLFNKARRP